jgi:hypothetical protein
MQKAERPPRPLGVTILMGIVLSLSAWNGLRLAQAIRFWDILTEYQVRNGPAYLAASGAAWLLAGVILAWGLGRGLAWSRGMTILAAVGYVAWIWFDRLVIQATRTNWLFALIVTTLLFSFTVLILLDPDVKAYFSQREAYERPS